MEVSWRGDARFAREFIERVSVDVDLVGDGGDEGQRLSVRTDDGCAQFEVDGQQCEPVPDAFEDDSCGFDLLRRTMSVVLMRLLRRPVSRARFQALSGQADRERVWWRAWSRGVCGVVPGSLGISGAPGVDCLRKSSVN